MAARRLRPAGAWLCLAVLLLAGCVAAPPPASRLDGAAARELLAGLGAFGFEGRVAVVRGAEGSQASLSWAQQGEESTLRLSGPLGIGAMQVQAGPQGLSIHTARGEQLQGEAARQALGALAGMEPAFAALRHWVLGLPAPGSLASEVLDADGRLAALEQQGWRVSFDEYREQPLGRVRVALPRRLAATDGSLRLRLVIDRWRFAP